MPKLCYLDPIQKLSVAQNGFSNLLRDIHRNDPVAKILFYFSATSVGGTADEGAILSNGTDLDTFVGNTNVVAGGGNLIGIAQIDALVAEANDVVAMHYIKVGSGYKIGRVEGETDSNLLAETAFGVPERTTFPSIQSFVERTLPNSAMRALLEATTGTWEPSGNLTGIAIKQSTQEIFGVFSATLQAGVTEVLAIVDLDDISDIHFGE